MYLQVGTLKTDWDRISKPDAGLKPTCFLKSIQSGVVDAELAGNAGKIVTKIFFFICQIYHEFDFTNISTAYTTQKACTSSLVVLNSK